MWQEKYEEFKTASWNFFKNIGIKEENLRWRQHLDDELSHYSKMTFDIEYKFPWGWGELEGFAYRTDFDLASHTKFSGQDMSYTDPITKEKYTPHCIEPSFGADRTVLTALLDSYTEEEVKGETRVVLKLDKTIAPVKIAILPLMKKDELVEQSRSIFNDLKKHFMVQYDETQSIGKRYRRQDEIGTPYCVTIDPETIEDKAVTVRDRDTMEQERIKIENLVEYFKEKYSR